MKKTIVALILITVIIVAGCSSNKNGNSSNDTQSTSVTNDKQIQNQEAKSPSIKGDYKINYDLIIGYGFEIIKKHDGSLLSRGKNTKGELGNGTLLDSDDWNVIQGIDDVKQIACAWNGEYGTVYALKNDGSLWYWGAEQVVPCSYPNVSGIKKLISKQNGLYGGMVPDNCHSYVFAQREDNTVIALGPNGEIKSDNYTGGTLHNIPLDDFSDRIIPNSDNRKTDRTYYIYNGEVYIVEGADDLNRKIENYSVDDSNGEVTELGYISGIYGLGGIEDQTPYFLNDKGILFYYNYNENTFYKSGQNVKSYFKMSCHDYANFTLVLYHSGNVQTKGDNPYGELGNGTNNYYSNFWTVNISPIKDVFTPLNGKVFAIDENNNLWSWGKGYSNLPQILYNIDELLSE